MLMNFRSALLLEFTIYACYKIWVADDNTKFDNIVYAILLGEVVWEFAYIGVGMLYKKRKSVLKKYILSWNM